MPPPPRNLALRTSPSRVGAEPLRGDLRRFRRCWDNLARGRGPAELPGHLGFPLGFPLGFAGRLQAAAQLVPLPLGVFSLPLGCLPAAALLRQLLPKRGLGPLGELQAHPRLLRPPRLLDEPIRELADSAAGALRGNRRSICIS